MSKRIVKTNPVVMVCHQGCWMYGKLISTNGNEAIVRVGRNNISVPSWKVYERKESHNAV